MSNHPKWTPWFSEIRTIHFNSFQFNANNYTKSLHYVLTFFAISCILYRVKQIYYQAKDDGIMSGVSLSDIAKDLKLSRMTISMIMNGHAEKWRISDATKEKVLTRAKEMGYRCNANARAMITGQTKLIGYLDCNIANEPSARTLNGLIKAAIANKYSVQPFTYVNEAEFERALYQLMGYRPDAVVYRMCSHENLKILRGECMNFNIPLLVHGSAFPMDWGLRVNTDDVAGARMAVRHLLELGHKKIYHIGYPDQKIEFADSRCQGFIEEMTEARISAPREMVLNIEIDPANFELQMVRLLNLNKEERPTAFFCVSDNVAMEAIRITRRLGLRVPDDISIIGFADLDMAKYADPPLTTVSEPFEEVGITIFNMLKNEIKNKESLNQEISQRVKNKLVIRESTKRRIENES